MIGSVLSYTVLRPVRHNGDSRLCAEYRGGSVKMWCEHGTYSEYVITLYTIEVAWHLLVASVHSFCT